MPIDDLCDIITRRRFTDTDRDEVRKLSHSDRDRLIDHAQKHLNDVLDGTEAKGNA